VFEPLILRDENPPEMIVVVRLGAKTLDDPHLLRSLEECHARWGVWGFSVLEVPNGDFSLLARLRPIIVERKLFLVAQGHRLVEAGFPLPPTLDSPHWTVALSSPDPEQLSRVRELFVGPIENPTYNGGSRRLH
jgi:hypothetical protein